MPEPDHLLGVGSGSHARADRARPGATRAGAAGRAPRPGDRPGRRQLHRSARRSARRSWESRSPTSSRDCGASTARCLRRRTGSCADLIASALLPALRRGDRRTCAPREWRSRANEVRRQHDDRHPGGAHRPDPRAQRRPRPSASSPGATCWSRCTGPPSSTGRCCGEAMRRLSEVGRELPVVFPVHPRTRKMLDGRLLPRGHRDRPGRLPRLPLARGSRPAPSSPTPAGSRRRRPTSGSPASRFATTPSGR